MKPGRSRLPSPGAFRASEGQLFLNRPAEALESQAVMCRLCRGGEGRGREKGPGSVSLRTLLMLNWPSKRQPAPLFSGIFMELSMWPTSCLPISSWMSSPTTVGAEESSHPHPHPHPHPCRAGTARVCGSPISPPWARCQGNLSYVGSRPVREKGASWLRVTAPQNSPIPPQSHSTQNSPTCPQARHLSTTA